MATIARPNVGEIIADLPFDYFCSNRYTISSGTASCVRCISLPNRHKKEKICKNTNAECWLHDERSKQLELEVRLEVSVEEVHVVDVKAVQTAKRRNIFYLFENLFEECTE